MREGYSLIKHYSGLGFALCCRLIDEFLFTRPQSQTLHLLFSTRDTEKGQDTLARLNEHLQKTLREANGKTLGISLVLQARIKIENVLVDLLKLPTVKALAEQLLRRGERLDAVVWNAGIAGWKGLNWPRAIWDVVTDLPHATTYPMFMQPDLGLLAKRQIQSGSNDSRASTIQYQQSSEEGEEEPILGQVFTANVFGHYFLTHWLSPLMHASTRIIWISSVSAVAETFTISDIQGLQAWQSYEASKRLTDFLVLTSELPSTEPFLQTFFSSSTSPPNQRPKMLVVHPGVVGTSIAGLNWFISLFMLAAFYIARWLGSPWHPIHPYKGAVSAAFAVLAPQILEQEAREGKGKWGSAAGVTGDERVARTEVEGWGYNGVEGEVPPGSVTAGLFRGRKALTKERREEFEEIGRKVWKEMEDMRIEWERRLGPVSQKEPVDV